MPDLSYLFVYGSLRPGAGTEWSKFLATASDFVGAGRVQGALYQLDGYPGMTVCLDEGAWVTGDVCRLHDSSATLLTLDAYEGCGPGDPVPHEFVRQAVTVLLDSGDTVEAWAYLYARETQSRERISSGDYLQRPMDGHAANSVRESYDRMAAEYARRIYDELQHKPLDRALLDRFAAAVRGHGEVCDMGCGPGHVARYLQDAGATVFGLDISPGMLEQARRLNPGIRFREGSMLALDLPDGSLAGIAAFYAIVNIPEESLPVVFREMQRVLEPAGLLLLAFHVGDEVLHEDEVWDQKISLDFFFFRPAEIRRYIEAAGFAIEDVIEREPYPDAEYQSRRAYIFARKTGALEGGL
ncbi:MAG TPA: gamma-glutamylcyclotransferase [Bryobacteraceae bacterium]|nr:gamma-glutamylcyclotransferase [Bryobacteraceae bacterium]